MAEEIQKKAKGIFSLCYQVPTYFNFIKNLFSGRLKHGIQNDISGKNGSEHE